MRAALANKNIISRPHDSQFLPGPEQNMNIGKGCKVFSIFLKITALIVAVFLGACASTNRVDEGVQNSTIKIDKFEKLNRKVFAFNDGLDRILLKPVAKGYLAISPKPVEIGVSNFFDNLAEITNVFNDLLQWKWKQAGNDTGRLLLNSTVGLLGLIDVASKTGMEKSAGEDSGNRPVYRAPGSGRRRRGGPCARPARVGDRVG